MNIESASYVSNSKTPGIQISPPKNTAIKTGSVNVSTVLPISQNVSNQNGSNYQNYSMYSLDHGHIQKANFSNSPDTRNSKLS